MIKIHQISKINIQNYYQYIFDKRYGNGNGFSDRFRLSNGDGDSFSSKYLIRNYKSN